MSQLNWYAKGEGTVEGTIRVNWLKAMYIANIIISLPIGLAVVVAPETMRGILSVPTGDPIHYGIASGAVPLAFGIAGVLGLRLPLRLSPVLGLQILYKSIFLVGVVLPLTLRGEVPDYAVPVIGIFLFFIIGNTIALPFRYLLFPSS